MRPRRPFAALLLAGAVLGAGCGGDDEAKNAYVEEVRAAQQLYVTRFDQVLKRLKPTSTLDQDRATLGSFATVTGGFATALREAEPPEEVREEHRRLVAAVAAFRRQLQTAEVRLRGGTAAARAKVRTGLSSSVAATQREFVRKISDLNTALRG